jgi:hypothetical protein
LEKHKEAQENAKKLDEAVLESKELVLSYFGYVQNNMHFTAYTTNVEAAYELIERLIPYLNNDERMIILEGREKMVKKAEELRGEKLTLL